MRSAAWFLLCAFATVASAHEANVTSRPNLVLIMADDLGYETVGADGGTSYKTPVLDRLAATGARFTHCFVQPLCTPTRCQIMTGKYNVRNYTTFGELDPKSVTFGNLLQQAGYKTCVAGKWQLGRDTDLPQRFGFQEYCLWQHTRRPPRYANPGLEINGVEKNFSHGEYGPDLVADYALDFITRHQSTPFFLYYPMILTHAPYQPAPESDDWDPALSNERQKRSPRHFGDMVEHMDKIVGRLVRKLDELNLRNNTLLIFLGDNGTGKEVHSTMGGVDFAGGKGSTTDAGMHVPLIVNWPGHIQPHVCSDLVDSTDFLPTLLDAAHVKRPANIELDGVSFQPQLLGMSGQPRQWIYSWYCPRPNRNPTIREFAFNHKFKLYRTGEFYDLEHDPKEEHPLRVTNLTGASAKAARALQQAIDKYRHIRDPVSPDDKQNKDHEK
jgi:arylsulfatase A